MAEYTVVNNKTGREITFEWHDTSPPTEQDMDNIFADAEKMYGQQQSAVAPQAQNIALPQEEDPWLSVIGKSAAAVAPSFGKAAGGIIQAAEELSPSALWETPMKLMEIATTPFKWVGMPEVQAAFTKGLAASKELQKEYPELQDISLAGIERSMGMEDTLGGTVAREYGNIQNQMQPKINRGSAKAQVAGAIQTVGTMLPAIAAGIITRNPNVALEVMAAHSGATDYAEKREKGISPEEALAAGLLNRFTEKWTEKLPLEALLNKKLPFWKKLIASYATDVPGELLATTIEQGLIDTATTDPNKTFGEFLQDLADTAIQTFMVNPVLATGSHATMKFINHVENVQRAEALKGAIKQGGLDFLSDEQLKNAIKEVEELSKNLPKDKELSVAQDAIKQTLDARQASQEPPKPDTSQQIQDILEKNPDNAVDVLAENADDIIQNMQNEMKEKAGITKTETPKEETEEAAIPVMITNQMKQDLRGLGYTDEQISAMTPMEAWGVIQNKIENKPVESKTLGTSIIPEEAAQKTEAKVEEGFATKGGVEASDKGGEASLKVVTPLVPKEGVQDLVDKIDQDNKVVDTLSMEQLKLIEEDMRNNKNLYKGQYDDAQHIYNLVVDKIKSGTVSATTKGKTAAKQPTENIGIINADELMNKNTFATPVYGKDKTGSLVASRKADGTADVVPDAKTIIDPLQLELLKKTFDIVNNPQDESKNFDVITPAKFTVDKDGKYSLVEKGKINIYQGETAGETAEKKVAEAQIKEVKKGKAKTKTAESVKNVISPEGEKKAKAGILTNKQQKKYLIEEIDKAIKEADEGEPVLMLTKTVVNGEFKNTNVIDYSQTPTITIEVPGDGEFTIPNFKNSLAKFKEKVVKNFPSTDEVIPTEQPPSLPSSKPTGKRITGEGLGISYYNPYKVRKKGLIQGTEISNKDSRLGQFYVDGFYTNGQYAVKTDKPTNMSIVTDINIPSIDALFPTKDKLQPARIVAEFKPDTENNPVVHIIAEDGSEAVFSTEYIDSILTLHPNATVQMDKEGKKQKALFYDKGEPVGLAMALYDNKLLDKIRELLPERVVEISGMKKEGKNGESKQTAVEGKRELAESTGATGTARRPSIRVVGQGNIPKPREIIPTGQYSILDEHQRLGANLALTHFEKGGKGFLLADGTGTGKTMQILVIAKETANRAGKKALIVTENKQVIDGNFKADAKLLNLDMSNIELGTYNDLRTGKIGKGDYAVVIYDEAQNLKNVESGKTLASEQVKADHKLYATATPMDRPTGASYFMSQITGIPESQIQQQLGYTITTREDVNGNEYKVAELLPDTSWENVWDNIIKMRDKAIKDGAMIRREYPFYGTLEERNIKLDEQQQEEQDLINDYWNSLIASTKNRNMKKNFGGQRIGELSRWLEPIKINAVMNEVMQDIKEGKSVIIVAEGVNKTNIKAIGQEVPGIITLIGDKLKQQGIPYASIFGTGSKSDAVKLFQENKVQVALATPKSGGTGINLDDSIGNKPRVMYVVTSNFSGDLFQQILGRVSRKMTKSPATVKIFYAENGLSDIRRKEITHKKISTLQKIQYGTDLDEAYGFETQEETKARPTFLKQTDISNLTYANNKDIDKIDKFVNDFKKLLSVEGIKFEVIPNANAMPEGAKQFIGKKTEVFAFYWKGTVYINAEAFGNRGDLNQGAFHELVHVAGILKILKDNEPAMYEKAIQALDEYRAKNKEMWNTLLQDNNFDLNNPVDKAMAYEELLARIAQGKAKSGIIFRITQMIRKLLRKLGINERYSDKDIIDNLIKQSMAQVRMMSEWGKMQQTGRPSFLMSRNGEQIEVKDVPFAYEGLADDVAKRGNNLTFRVVRNFDEADDILKAIREGEPSKGFRRATSEGYYEGNVEMAKTKKADKQGKVSVYTSPYPTVSGWYREGADLFLAIEYEPKGLIHETKRVSQTQGRAYSAIFDDSEQIIDAKTIKNVWVLTPEQVDLVEQHMKNFQQSIVRGQFKGHYKDKDSALSEANIKNARNLRPVVTNLGRPFIEKPVDIGNGLMAKRGDRAILVTGDVVILKNWRELKPQQQELAPSGTKSYLEVSGKIGKEIYGVVSRYHTPDIAVAYIAPPNERVTRALINKVKENSRDKLIYLLNNRLNDLYKFRAEAQKDNNISRLDAINSAIKDIQNYMEANALPTTSTEKPSFLQQSRPSATAEPISGISFKDLQTKVKDTLYAFGKSASEMADIKNIPDMTFLERMFKNPLWYDNPTYKKLTDVHIYDRSNNYFDYLNSFNTYDETKESIVKASERLKKDKQQYNLFSKWTTWIDEYWVKTPEQSKDYNVFMRDAEKFLREKGLNDQAIHAWKLRRYAYDIKTLGKLMQKARELLDDLQETYGKRIDTKINKLDAVIKDISHKLDVLEDTPENKAERKLLESKLREYDREKFDVMRGDIRKRLSEAIAHMGELQGTYEPRERDQQGAWGVTAWRLKDKSRIKEYKELEAKLEEAQARLDSMYDKNTTAQERKAIKAEYNTLNKMMQQLKKEAGHERYFEIGGKVATHMLTQKLIREGWFDVKRDRNSRLQESVHQNLRILDISKAIEKALENVEGMDMAKEKFTKELLISISDVIKSRGARGSQIRRGTDVVKGYITDPVERLARYLSKVASGLAKSQAMEQSYNILSEVDNLKEPQVYDHMKKYIEEMGRNADNWDRFVNFLRGVASFKYLAFNVRSMLVNTFAIPTLTIPMIHQMAGNQEISMADVAKETSKAVLDYAKFMAGKYRGEDLGILEQFHKIGTSDAQLARRITDSMKSDMSSGWAKFMEGAMFMFSTTEQLNRGATALAAFRIAKQRLGDDAVALGKSFEIAQRVVKHAHADYSKANMPEWAWGAGVTGRIGRLLYQFGNYGHNYVQGLYYLGFKEHNIAGFMWALLAPLLIAGAGAFPFADNLVGIINWILRALGVKTGVDKWFWDNTRKALGTSAEMFGRKGLIGLAGGDVSGSMSVNIDIPSRMLGIFGAVGGVVEDVVKGTEYALKGEYMRAAEKFLPTAIANPIKAIREADTGIITERGNRIWTPEGKPLKPTPLSTAAQLAGFRSSGRTVLQEREWEAKQMELNYAQERQAINELYKYYLATNNPEKKADLWKDITRRKDKFNKEIKDKKLYPEITYITPMSLRAVARNMARPTKKEKARYAER